MCQKDLRWKLGLLGKIGAFRKNESAQGVTGVKQDFCKTSMCLRDFENRAHTENECAKITCGGN